MGKVSASAGQIQAEHEVAPFSPELDMQTERNRKALPADKADKPARRTDVVHQQLEREIQGRWDLLGPRGTVCSRDRDDEQPLLLRTVRASTPAMVLNC